MRLQGGAQVQTDARQAAQAEALIKPLSFGLRPLSSSKGSPVRLQRGAQVQAHVRQAAQAGP